MSDQLTTADVARATGLHPSTILRKRRAGLFPSPDGYLGNNPWWHIETVADWMAARPPRGRPKKAT